MKTTAPKRPLVGAHFSVSGGLHKALESAFEYGCTAMQIFTANARTWKPKKLTADDIDAFAAGCERTGIKEIASHTAYLINLAAPDPTVHERSCAALKEELNRSTALSIPYVVLHPGSHKDTGMDVGMEKITDSIRRIFDEVSSCTARLLLETTAGQGSGIGHTFEQIAEMLEKIGMPEKTGVCLDTSHIFAAGYDIRTPKTYERTLAEFDRIVGLDQLSVIHINDSKSDFGSRVDRHEHIGYGKIGIDAFGCIMSDSRLEKIPKILETPNPKGEKDWDKANLQTLFSLTSRAKCSKDRS